MATFLFWNINKRPLQNEIADLCEEYLVDVLILAEADVCDVVLLETLNRKKSALFRMPSNLSSRLKFFTRLPDPFFTSVHDERYIAIRRISPPIGVDLLLVAVHLPSKLWRKESSRVFDCTRLRKTIRDAELKTGHTRTVVVGDLNMNPFEVGVVASDAIHGVMDRATARRVSRVVSDQECEFFYNPMWGRMGDASKGPPGTYYYDSSEQVSYFWNTFDQVLIRPSLLDIFPDDGLKVLTSANGKKLVRANNIPDDKVASDHLPILFTIDTEKGA
jgi:hypothetical protein